MFELKKTDNGINESNTEELETCLFKNIETNIIENSITKTNKHVEKRKGKKSKLNHNKTDDINIMIKRMPLSEEITCGFWICKGKFLQKFANQRSYVIIYGLVGCIFSMTYAYLNGTLTTIEKRFKIPSKNTGIIIIGYDISQLLIAGVLSYYAGKGHRPRWIGFGLLTIAVCCLLMSLPHFIYGPGEDAYSLTTEFGNFHDINTTNTIINEQQRKLLCHLNESNKCEDRDGNLIPQIIFFLAQFISGIGGSLYASLGISYLDDNTEKAKTPALLSLAYFVRMLGPALGYTLASFCLRFYIVPGMKPFITNTDPRWVGAWWIGWLFSAGVLLFFSVFLSMFPKKLPYSVAKRLIEEEGHQTKTQILNDESICNINDEQNDSKASFKDMLKTFKELFVNKTFMYNNWSSVFYFLGYTPFWIFTPKYIEIQYLQSAATANMVTGSVGLAFSAVGVLTSGFIISRYQPKARYLAAWNVIVGFLSVLGIITYAFLGCPDNEKSFSINNIDSSKPPSRNCNSVCNCDYVQYSPVCGENNLTYISPCHAGCKEQFVDENGQKRFYQCGCITTNMSTLIGNLSEIKLTNKLSLAIEGGQASFGACSVDCFIQFCTFLGIMCCLKFLGAAGRASNFLITIRCVPEKDKVAAMGFDMMMMALLAFIPGPIIFGWLLDSLCLVWGKTCTSQGNCWVYDPRSVRYILNLTAAVLIGIGSSFDIFVWYYVKELKIFDDEPEHKKMKSFKKYETTFREDNS